MNTRRIYNGINRRFGKFSEKIFTLITRIKAKLLGIDLGKGNKFFGIPYFNITEGATVSIGNNCSFRSRMTSNKMGLNHRVMLSCAPTTKGEKAELTIGNNCGFSGTTIRCFTRIDIGNNVRIGVNSIIMDGDGHFSDPRTAPPQPIILEDNVFVGANCIVKKGVRIGANSVIGMNSVVTKDIPANSVAVGVPARVIRTLVDSPSK